MNGNLIAGIHSGVGKTVTASADVGRDVFAVGRDGIGEKRDGLIEHEVLGIYCRVHRWNDALGPSINSHT